MSNAKKTAIILLTTGFGSGYAPIASGTFGTVVGILYFLAFMHLPAVVYFWLLTLLTIIACWASGYAEQIFNQKDSGKIVIDEIVGYLFTMFMVPVAFGSGSEIIHDFLPKVIAGFFLFRFTDILKPFPARWIDKNMGGGSGVVLDDVVAGVYANILMHLGLFVWTKFL